MFIIHPTTGAISPQYIAIRDNYFTSNLSAHEEDNWDAIGSAMSVSEPIENVLEVENLK